MKCKGESSITCSPALLLRLRTRGATRAVALGLSLGLGAGASAGTATVSSGDGGTSTFEYSADALRINAEAANSNSYVIVRDGSMYSVMDNDGQIMVIDAGSMMKGFSGFASQAAPSQLDSKVISLKDTGKNETVAGVKGDIYELLFEEKDGTERTEEVVLSKDKRAREFRDALFMMMSFAKDIASDEAMEQGRDMRKRLEKMNVGILRMGTEMTVTSISGEKVAASRFALPAEPMNLEGIGSMLSEMSKGMSTTQPAGDAAGSAEQPAKKKGGLFSSMMGALGDKTERQTDRAGAVVDDKVDEETNEAVDSAIGKALGKLFGD
jgi:hypothetical protein